MQLVRDLLVMPLLDGSRGIDFTSPHGIEGSIMGFDSKVDAQREAELAAAGGAVQADSKELQLLAYVLRLLERKRIVMRELKSVCAEAERELRRIGAAILAAVDAGDTELHVDRGDLRPPPIRIEVTAAQQRVLGQVQPLPELPALAAVFAQLKATQPADASKLERQTNIWKAEVEWLQDELRSTARALDTALAALRPTAQRFSLALGAAAPEPQSGGLGIGFVAQLRDNAMERTASVLSSALASRPGVATLPAQQLRENASAAVSLLLQMQTWATAPMSSVECREELQAALKKLTPQCEANRTKFADVMATAQQLQAILCGSGENARKG